MSNQTAQHEPQPGANIGGGIAIFKFVIWLLPTVIATFLQWNVGVFLAVVSLSFISFSGGWLLWERFASKPGVWQRSPITLRKLLIPTVGGFLAFIGCWLGGVAGLILAGAGVVLVSVWALPVIALQRARKALTDGTASADVLNHVAPAFYRGLMEMLARLCGFEPISRLKWRRVAPPAEDMPNDATGVVTQAEDPRPMSRRSACQADPGAGVLNTTPIKGHAEVGWVHFPGEVRGLITANSGHGKSVLIDQLIIGWLKQGYDVLLLDGKGAKTDADALAEKARNAGASVHQWESRHQSDSPPCDPLNFVGHLDAPDIVRVLQIASRVSTSATGGDPFYDQQREAAFEIIAQYLVTLPEQDRSLRTIEKILNNPIPTTGPLAGLDRQVTRDATLGDLAALGLQGFIARLVAKDSPQGWIPGETPGLGIISASGRTGEGRSGLAAVLTRLAAGIPSRSAGNPRPLMVVIDEAPEIMGVALDEIRVLASQGRSANMYLWLAFQDLSQLEPRVAQELASLAEVIFVGQTSNASRIFDITGGGRFQEEATRSGTGQGSEGSTSRRAQQAYPIPPGVIEGLPKFIWILEMAGQWRIGFFPLWD